MHDIPCLLALTPAEDVTDKADRAELSGPAGMTKAPMLVTDATRSTVDWIMGVMPMLTRHETEQLEQALQGALTPALGTDVCLLPISYESRRG